jgi:hypothetical protein
MVGSELASSETYTPTRNRFSYVVLTKVLILVLGLPLVLMWGEIISKESSVSIQNIWG